MFLASVVFSPFADVFSPWIYLILLDLQLSTLRALLTGQTLDIWKILDLFNGIQHSLMKQMVLLLDAERTDVFVVPD